MARWAADTSAWLPDSETLETWSDRYWHFKVPIHDKLVSSSHTTPAIKHAVAQSLLCAAAEVSTRLALRRTHRVACLIIPEDLFSSEVTIFFDESYFQTFLPPAAHRTTRMPPYTVSTEPANIDLVSEWELVVPAGLADFGGYRVSECDDNEADAPRISHNWLFAEPTVHPPS